MSLNDDIYKKIRTILYTKCPYPLDQIQPQIRFEIELAIDSLEMYELIAELEQTFDIKINPDDIDNFIFQSQDIQYVNEIKSITIQDAVNHLLWEQGVVGSNPTIPKKG